MQLYQRAGEVETDARSRLLTACFILRLIETFENLLQFVLGNLLTIVSDGNNGILMKQRKRVDIVFRKWNEWGWIDDSTSPDDFDAFFEGEPRHCNIAWMTNTTILTILMQELLKQPYIEKQTGCSAKSLVEHQFEKTPNSDKTRLDADSEEKINLTLLILDIHNPLPEGRGRNHEDEFDIKDEALREIYAGKLRSTKGI